MRAPENQAYEVFDPADYIDAFFINLKPSSALSGTFSRYPTPATREKETSKPSRRRVFKISASKNLPFFDFILNADCIPFKYCI